MSPSAELPFIHRPPGSPGEVERCATAAARAWGLPAPVLLRLGSNAIYACGDDVVLRLCRPSAPPEQAIWLARLLGEAGVRVPRFVRDEPMRFGEICAFAVEFLHPVGTTDWIEVGQMVRRVHGIDPAAVAGRYPMPWCATFPWWRFGELLETVGDALDPEALAALTSSVERHLPLLEASRALQGVVCHGDVHPGNVLQSDAGAVLIDWDLVCRGPVAWDHGPMMTWAERWGGATGEYEAFAQGYGVSLRGDPLGEAVAELRLVAATLMRVKAGLAEPRAMGEAQSRLRWWRGDPSAPTWQAQ